MDAVKHEKAQLRRSQSATSTILQDGALQGSNKKERVWVGVRIRPLLEQELLAREQPAWKAVQNSTLQCLEQDRSATQQNVTYQYNRVFPETSTSEDVYADAASSIVAAAVNGYNGTLFAYGQTGSGKTYTMQAIMACAAKDVFSLIAQDASREFIIRMAALEIYNENVRDLLQEKSPSVKLLDDPIRGTVADGLSEAGVASEQQLLQLLEEVAARRQTRATRMNDNSSRSHAIVRLYIESRPLSSGGADASSTQDLQPQQAAPAAKLRSSVAVTTAAINFVDLAGSERAAHSADTGEQEKLRAKEAGNIHKSLLTLSCVIRGLADNQRHLPYRDSKLTRLLQPFLSGNSHMAIITTISPAAGSADNTRAALHFATAAARVMMRPQLNRVASSKAVIKAMASEIQQLKAKLVRLESDQAAMKQKEAEAATAAQERDTLRNKLKVLQDQILRGDQATATQAVAQKLRASVDSPGPLWQNRVALARELRASSAGFLSGRVTSDSSTACDNSRGRSRPSTSGGGSSCSTFAATPDLRSSSSGGHLSAASDVRRSMRLLNCYLPRNAVADASSSEPGISQPQQQQQQQMSRQQQHARQQQQQQQPPAQQSGWHSILQQAAPKQQQSHATSRLQQQAPKQQQQQPDEVVRALQMQKLQEPCGPEAEAAMACLEVEVRCYKHVQDYTLAELSAALQHLESQAAAGQGTGSWSTDQLEALRSEVARKRAAEALTQLGDKALNALARKVNSYTSSADTSPFVDLKRQLRSASSRDASLLEAALASAAAVAAAAQQGGTAGAAAGSRRVSSPETVLSHDGDPGSWPDMAPRLLSGRTTPTFRVPGGRGSIIAGALAAFTPNAAAPAAARAAGQLVQQQAAVLTPEDSSTSSAAGSGPAAGESCSSSTAGSSRRHSAVGTGVSGPAAAVSPTSTTAAVVAQEQLLRMQEAWRESVEKDVICLREVLGQYKEQAERLEMQKKLLLSQVLKLEFTLEEEETQSDHLQQQLQQTQQQLQQALRERDAARAAATPAVAASGPSCTAAGTNAAASTAAGCEAPGSAAPTTPRGPGALHVALPPINTAAAGIFDACSDDGWASTPTVDSLLPKIVALWDELYVPLVYRSRFFLCFRGREVFYYEVEARRLDWKRSQMLQGATEEASMSQLARGSYGLDGGSTPTARGSTGPNGTPRPLSAAAAAGLTASSSSFGGMRRRSRELDKAARALDWERKSLAAGLKWNLTEAEREELYRTWGVDPDTKERKLQLVFKLWSKEMLQQPDGMQRSSELVVMLCGMDASEHMMELVFGSHLREYGTSAGPPMGRTSSSGISYALSNVVRRLAPPLSRAGAIGSSPLRSSMTSTGPSAFGGGYGGQGYGPSRAGGSFTSKLMHSGFMSLLGSKERSNLSSHHLAGMGGGSVGPASREGSFSSLASSVLPGRR